MKEIQLSNKGKYNFVAIVDDEDYERVSRHRWYARKNRNYFYAITGTVINGERKNLYMHKLVMNHTGDAEIVDHKNRNTLDNQKGNLRICDRSQNRVNSRKRTGTKSKFIGVTFVARTGKWNARVSSHGKSTFLGYFDCEIDAAKEYDKAALKIHGDFANLNFKE